MQVFIEFTHKIKDFAAFLKRCEYWGKKTPEVDFKTLTDKKTGAVAYEMDEAVGQANQWASTSAEIEVEKHGPEKEVSFVRIHHWSDRWQYTLHFSESLYPGGYIGFYEGPREDFCADPAAPFTLRMLGVSEVCASIGHFPDLAMYDKLGVPAEKAITKVLAAKLLAGVHCCKGSENPQWAQESAEVLLEESYGAAMLLAGYTSRKICGPGEIHHVMVPQTSADCPECGERKEAPEDEVCLACSSLS